MPEGQEGLTPKPQSTLERANKDIAAFNNFADFVNQLPPAGEFTKAREGWNPKTVVELTKEYADLLDPSQYPTPEAFRDATENIFAKLFARAGWRIKPGVKEQTGQPSVLERANKDIREVTAPTPANPPTAK